jgi:hypothetical protein
MVAGRRRWDGKEGLGTKCSLPGPAPVTYFLQLNPTSYSLHYH